jgi:RimJ/RimL family protein N-acetyltransferase
MSVEIVPIERRHIGGFREVLDGVARERRWLAFLEAPPLPRVRSFVLNGLRNGMTQFVAVDDGRVVGWCDVNPKSHETLRHSGVLGMGVAASHRGQGLGAALLRATLEVAAASGIRRVELIVRADNAAAIRLYEKHGFELEGRLREYLIVDGRAYDALQMARLAARGSGGGRTQRGTQS